MAGKATFRGDQEDAVFIERPFLRAMQVIDIGLIDGEAERGDVPGDALGAEQNIIGDALRRLIVIVERRSAIVWLGGWMLPWVLVAAFGCDLAGFQQPDVGVGPAVTNAGVALSS